MKVGLGVRLENRARKEFLQYASQIGVTHTIVSLPDETILPGADTAPWSIDALTDLTKLYAENGLKIEGFENFDPKMWYKILLDLPGKEEQMDYLKYCIQNMGKAGIKIMGYNFSIGGVCARYQGPFARGGATTVRFDATNAPVDAPIPLGWAWNRQVYEPETQGNLPFVSVEEITQRRDWFFSQILPVAEEAGVQMAAHPEDPPVPVLNSAGRIITSVAAYEDLFRKFDSKYNCAEFCQGTLGEMGEDVYGTIRSFCARDKISYVHFRNIQGTIPTGGYTEVFIDEGDVDMVQALTVYKECGYTGLLMPDHTPTITCAHPEETGMAYAVGYIRGLMKALDIEIDPPAV